jgi:hypothetical protein
VRIPGQRGIDREGGEQWISPRVIHGKPSLAMARSGNADLAVGDTVSVLCPLDEASPRVLCIIHRRKVQR